MSLPVNLRYKGSGRWTVLSDMVYRSRYGTVKIPAGFETDLASVPRLPFAHMLAANRAVSSAVIHDVLYANPVVYTNGTPKSLTRRQADIVLKDAMIDEGVSWGYRMMIYTGVRMGGMLAWHNHRKNDT